MSINLSEQDYSLLAGSYTTPELCTQARLFQAVLNIRSAFISDNVPGDAGSEVHRAATRFALIAAAGESAHEVTGWESGEALKAAAKMFQVWLDGRGTRGSSDIESAIRQVRAFIESHGASRFQPIDDNEARIINRVGFKRTNLQGQTEYLILKEAFRKELCSGYDSTAVAHALSERGFLKRGDGKNLACAETLPEIGRTRVYVLYSTLLGGK